MENREDKQKSQKERLVGDAIIKAKNEIENITDHTRVEKLSELDPFYFPHKPIGKTAAILNTVFGSILAIGFGIPVFVLALVGGSSGVILGLSVPMVLGLTMEFWASKLFYRIKRYKRYLSLFKGSNFCFIEELAEYSGFSRKFVLKDLRKMLFRGTFPHAHITQDNSLILLTKDSYDRYIFEQRKRKMLKDEIEQNQNVQLVTENNSVVIEGRELIRQVSSAKINIRDTDIKDKINQLEDITMQIINHVENHPEQIGNVRRFIQYYLPSVVKLLKVYEELEKHSFEGENIIETKGEIKKSLDVINHAFEKLFNNLFAGISTDISSDIAVLNALIAEDGLAKDEFKS